MESSPDPRPLSGFEPGTVLLNRYEIKTVLGRGAMGEVLEVHDRNSGLNYALKRVPPQLTGDGSVMNSIRKNFRLVSRLTHPNIATARFLEADPGNGSVYLIMDLVRGQTLGEWLKDWRAKQGRDDAPLPLDVALGIAEQAAAALDYAHALHLEPGESEHGRGILHQDLKPANVMLEPAREARPGVPGVKLVDFGLAAEIQASITAFSVKPAREQVSGTPSYMAPEQWSGRTLTAAVDQWALAVLIYEMAEGARPFAGPKLGIVRDAILRADPPRPAHVPGNAWEALRVAFSKDRKQRYRSCAALVEAVRAGASASTGSLAVGASALEPTLLAPPVLANAASDPPTLAPMPEPPPPPSSAVRPASPPPLAAQTPASGNGKLIVAALAGVALAGAILFGAWRVVRAPKASAKGQAPSESGGGSPSGPKPSPGLLPGGEAVPGDTKPTPDRETEPNNDLDPGFVGGWRVGAPGGDIEKGTAFMDVYPDGQALVIRMESINAQLLGGTIRQERGLLKAKDGKWSYVGAGRREGSYERLDDDTVRTTGPEGLVLWKRAKKEDLVDPKLAGRWKVYWFKEVAQPAKDKGPPLFDYGRGDGSTLTIHPQGFFEISSAGPNAGGQLRARGGKIESDQWNLSGAYYIQMARQAGDGQVTATYAFESPDRLRVVVKEHLGEAAASKGAWFTDKERTVWYTRGKDGDAGTADELPAPPFPMVDTKLVGTWKLASREGPQVNRYPHLRGGQTMEIAADGQFCTIAEGGRRGPWQKVRALDNVLHLYRVNLECFGTYEIDSAGELIYRHLEYGGFTERWTRVSR